jgi:hypothetical protein
MSKQYKVTEVEASFRGGPEEAFHLRFPGAAAPANAEGPPLRQASRNRVLDCVDQ